MDLQYVWGKAVTYKSKFLSFYLVCICVVPLALYLICVQEYGRGTGADCRRHVQKLNSLRGELLEVANERARTQW